VAAAIGAEAVRRRGAVLAVVLWMMAAAVPTCLMTDCSEVGSGRTAGPGAAVIPPAIEASPLKQDLDDLNGALQSLRDAGPGKDLPALYGAVRSDVERLLKAFVLVAERCEAVVAAGQRRLDAWSGQGEAPDPVAAPGTSAVGRRDLALAVDSLLMCRSSYAMSCASYRTQIARVISTLDHRLALSTISAVTPAITTLLEGEAGVRSIVTDASAKSRAVIALLLEQAHRL
jgi:hypothetical protein